MTVLERDPISVLSANEEAALALLATGNTRAQIAQRLVLSESTVGHLLTAAKDKLGARTLPHAVHILTGLGFARSFE